MHSMVSILNRALWKIGLCYLVFFTANIQAQTNQINGNVITEPNVNENNVSHSAVVDSDNLEQQINDIRASQAAYENSDKPTTVNEADFQERIIVIQESDQAEKEISNASQQFIFQSSTSVSEAQSVEHQNSTLGGLSLDERRTQVESIRQAIAGKK